MDRLQSPSLGSHETSSSEEPKVVGNAQNFWLWTAMGGFDLTHPLSPIGQPVMPRIGLTTANSTMTIAPQKTALIIVDMQNIWLSQPLRPRGPGHDAEEKLLKYGIPAARKAGIQIVWLNWGVSEGDLATLSPTTMRIFGFRMDGTCELDKGIGHDMGLVKMENGAEVRAGRFLMREQWNTELHWPLEAERQKGLKAYPADVQFSKNRISGMCDTAPECTDFLTRNGFKTLLFAGVNTDVCVMATLQDANSKGFHTVLLKDGCGTTNGEEARVATERNCLQAWGFISSCRELAEGVQRMKQESS